MNSINMTATRFIITKATKTRLTMEDAYSGPSCEDAGVPYGKLYTSKCEAEKDLIKLCSYNKITPFRVAELK